jgi:type II secretory pathway component PulF
MNPVLHAMTAPGDNRHGRALSPNEAGALADDLSQLAGSGLPLAEGLLVLADEGPSARLRAVYRELGQQLQSGASLEDAIEALGERVPAELRGLAAAGVATGRLGEVLVEVIGVQNRVHELRRHVWRSLAYPALLLFLLLGVLVLAKQVVVEPMADVLEFAEILAINPGPGVGDEDLGLPTATQLLLAMPGLDLYGGITLATCVIIIWFCVRYSTARVRHRLAGSLPLLGPIWRNSSWAGFSGLLAALLEARVPLPRALALTAQGLYDRDLADACERLGAAVAGGQPLWAGFNGRRLPASLGPLVEWGTKHGTLPDVLRSAAEMFIARSQAQSQFVRTVLPPLMFLVIFAGIGFLFMAMYLPMLAGIQRLAG